MNKMSKVKILLTTITFGAIWGIVEATLGTVLHLPFFDKVGMFAASSTIIIPIAYALMALCYKKTGSLFSVPLMGVIASLIKLMVAFFVGFIPSVYNPAIYIIVESLCMFGALAIFKPKDVLSLRTLASIIVANTLYQASFLLIKMSMGGTNIFASQAAWINVGEKYLFKFNCVAILYTFAVGSTIYGILHLLRKLNFKFKFDFNKIINSPITAATLSIVAIAATLTLSLI
jgi:hypothetical protein